MAVLNRIAAALERANKLAVTTVGGKRGSAMAATVDKGKVRMGAAFKKAPTQKRARNA